jgi:predicted metal-dependent enzyme (double-stranded beta helix superfamily)
MKLQRLHDFVKTATAHYAPYGSPAEASAVEATLMPKIHEALSQLIATDDWLPEDCAVPHLQYYQQYLLHCDPLERFSLVSFVWGPGQGTPVHDHTVWGLIGMLRGEEHSQAFHARRAEPRQDRLRHALGRAGHPSGAQRIRRSRLDQHSFL